MHRLLALLGTGQTKLKGTGDKSYCQTIYLRTDTNQTFETPFFAEALANLHPNTFDKVEIFGTHKSMWETLLVHCTRDSIDDKFFKELTNQDSENRQVSKEALEHVAKRFVEKNRPHIKDASCHIIPEGRNSEEIWRIFQAIITSCQEGDTVSADITHGLRYQSFFLLLVAVLLRTVKKVKIGSIFYGAFELNNENKAPILNLHPIVEILDWTLAINDFQSYSNAEKISHLLKDEECKGLKESLEIFTDMLQINALDKVVSESRRISSFLGNETVKSSLPDPAKLFFPEIQKLPAMLREGQGWKNYLKIARWQLEHGQLGLSVMSTWEALIDRIATILNVQGYENNYKAYIELSKIARAKDEYAQYFSELSEFSKKADILNEYRKGIAHADGFRISVENFRADFEKILGYFEQNLKSELIEQIEKQKVKEIFEANLKK